MLITQTQIKEKSILNRSFTIASVGFLLIVSIGFILKLIVDRTGVIANALNSSSTKFNFEMYSQVREGQWQQLARISLLAITLIIISSILTFIWAFRATRASRPFIFITFGLYVVAQGSGFGLLFITWRAIELLGIFGVAGGLFGAMAITGYLAKNLSGMRHYLIAGMIIILVMSIIWVILYFVGIYSDTFTMMITVITGILFLAFSAYDVWRIKRTSAWAKANNLDSEMTFRLSMFFGFRLLSDLIGLIWVVVRIYSRIRK